MEKQIDISYIVIACSVIAVFVTLGFILFVIIQKIHRHKLEAAKEILKTQNNEEIQRIKVENEQIRQDIVEIREQLKKMVD
jgi:Tfp pilus assembly protein PilO